MSYDLENSLASKDVKDIHILYESMMAGFSEEKAYAVSILDEDGYLVELYAPGYDNNGVADISAECL